MLEGKRGERRIGITIGTSIYTLYTLNCYLGRQHDSPAPSPRLPHRRARRALSLPQPGLAAVEACGVSLSAQDLIVVSTALICATGNGYLFVAAVHDGHRALYRAAGVTFFVFVLVAAVFFLRTL
jgi:hypothetical protein